MPKLYTYQDVARLARVHPKTVARWFKHRRKFHPTRQTVRIAESDLVDFLGRPVSA